MVGVTLGCSLVAIFGVIDGELEGAKQDGKNKITSTIPESRATTSKL